MKCGYCGYDNEPCAEKCVFCGVEMTYKNEKRQTGLDSEYEEYLEKKEAEDRKKDWEHRIQDAINPQINHSTSAENIQKPSVETRSLQEKPSSAFWWMNTTRWVVFFAVFMIYPIAAIILMLYWYMRR